MLSSLVLPPNDSPLGIHKTARYPPSYYRQPTKPNAKLLAISSRYQTLSSGSSRSFAILRESEGGHSSRWQAPTPTHLETPWSTTLRKGRPSSRTSTGDVSNVPSCSYVARPINRMFLGPALLDTARVVVKSCGKPIELSRDIDTSLLRHVRQDCGYVSRNTLSIHALHSLQINHCSPATTRGSKFPFHIIALR